MFVILDVPLSVCCLSALFDRFVKLKMRSPQHTSALTRARTKGLCAGIKVVRISEYTCVYISLVIEENVWGDHILLKAKAFTPLSIDRSVTTHPTPSVNIDRSHNTSLRNTHPLARAPHIFAHASHCHILSGPS